MVLVHCFLHNVFYQCVKFQVHSFYNLEGMVQEKKIKLKINKGQ